LKLFVDIFGNRHEIDLPVTGNVDYLEIDGKGININYCWLRNNSAISLIINGITYTAEIDPGSEHCNIQIQGKDFETQIFDERSDAIRKLTGAESSKGARSNEIKAPMPGLIVKLQVGEGDTVEPGQGLIIVEAMKMENEIYAQSSGVVEKINVKPGQTVNKGELLIALNN